MKRRYSGGTTVAVSLFLISGVLAGVLGLRELERHGTEEVWALNGDWPAGAIVQSGMLRRIRVESEAGGVGDARLLIGRQLVTAKGDGEPLRPVELRPPARSWLAQQVPQNRVLYSFIPRKGSIPHTQLRNGDRFDVLVRGRHGVRTVARDARLIGVLVGKTPAVSRPTGLAGLTLPPAGRPRPSDGSPLVIAVAPEEVYPLASIGPQEEVTIALHPAAASPDGARRAIEPEPTHRRIELLSGLRRRSVDVRQ